MTARAGFAATVVGMVLLAELAITNLAFTADSEFVYWFGHRINVVCAARQRLGIPCPTCGFTRGFVLTTHGRVAEAWKLSPLGPLSVVGIFGMGVALLIFAALERRRSVDQLAKVRRWIQNGALAYGGLASLIWISSWISVVANLSRTKG